MLSAVIITYNEEANIAACLDGLAWAGELVVVDSGSTDATARLAQEHGARLIAHPFVDYSAQKNFALAQAAGDWILSLDADERVTPALADEIQAAIARPGDKVAFYLPRQDFMFGRWIRHGEWWPCYKLRLVQRGRGQWRRAIHEVLVADGPVGRLREPLLHYTHRTISEFVRKMDRYTTLEAEAWQAQGVRPSLWKMLLYPPGLFLYEYVWLRGALDGRYGLILATLMAYYTFLKRAKLWELSTQSRQAPPRP